MFAAVLVALVPATAGASTTLGSAVGDSTCNAGFDESVVQSAAVGPSYVVPGSGTLTDWSTDAGTTSNNYTAKFAVWTKTSSTTYTLDFISSAQTINVGSGVNTFALSPPVAVTAGEVIGLIIVTGATGVCAHGTGNSGDVMLTPSSAPPPVGGSLTFGGQVNGVQVDVAATFQPTATPTTTTTSPTPSPVTAAFTG